MKGSGKSVNLLGNYADGVHNDTDAGVKICANDCKKCWNSFFAISSQHVTVMNIYSSMDAAIILYLYG